MCLNCFNKPLTTYRCSSFGDPHPLVGVDELPVKGGFREDYKVVTAAKENVEEGVGSVVQFL